MYRLFVLLFLLNFPTAALALEKADALTCVNRGIAAFLAGGPIDHLVDIAKMKDRESITAPDAKVAALLNERAAENKDYYRRVSAIVQGVPQAKSDGYFLVAGRVKGQERETKDSPWTAFDYNYIIWMRPTDEGCLIGVLAIEEVFRLAVWLKQELAKSS